MSQPNKTTAVTPFDSAKKILSDDNFKKQIALALPRHMTADRMLRVALTACLKQPKITEACSTSAGKASLCQAMLLASQLGLELDGRQAHLVPFKDKNLGMIVQFIPGYQGLIGLAYNHPKVKAIWADVVYEKDTFIHKKGLDRILEHVPADEDDRGELTHAYAVCEMEGGAKTFVCLTKRDVMKAKKSSRGSDSDYSPWNTFPEAMWAKTAIRNLCKFIPQSSELREALDVDDENNPVTIDVKSEAIPSDKPMFIDPDFQSQPINTDASDVKHESKHNEPEQVKTEPIKTEEPKPKSTEDELVKLSADHGALTTKLNEWGVAHEDFLSWIKTTGRVKQESNHKTIASLPQELCIKILSDPNFEKVKKIYGAK